VRHFTGFVAVGAIGFAAQSAVVTILMVEHDVDPVAAWSVAFALAVSLTWFLNRTFVFRGGQPLKGRTQVEYARYLLVQIGGALLSLLVFTAVLSMYPWLRDVPILAVGSGAAVALLFNFAGAKWWVFKSF
jgi:putative flippase GtrA